MCAARVICKEGGGCYSQRISLQTIIYTIEDSFFTDRSGQKNYYFQAILISVFNIFPTFSNFNFSKS
jgi:hypothetical protein